MREIYFHEDEYCHLELTPNDNLGFCSKHMDEIDESSEKHKEGIGWTDIVVRDENPVPLSGLKIELPDLVASIPEMMVKFDRVITGYSSYRIQCKNTLAFGPDDRLVMFVETKSNNVEAIWFTFNLRTPKHVSDSLKLTNSLTKWPVMIADWGWSEIIKLDDVDKLTNYFHKRQKIFADH